MAEASKQDFTIVDDVLSVRTLLDSLEGAPVNPPSLYISAKGINLGRKGTLSTLSLYVRPQQKTYLLDVPKLGYTAFSTSSTTGNSLRSILGSPTIPKVFFDVRDDSDALFSLYNIPLRGTKDLQIMEFASQSGFPTDLKELGECIRSVDSGIPTADQGEWQRTKALAIEMSDPECGGRVEVFRDRPMKPQIIQDCINDVRFLPALYDDYNAKLWPEDGRGAFSRVQVRFATEERIKNSQDPLFDVLQALDKAKGPWDSHNLAISLHYWNEDHEKSLFEVYPITNPDPWSAW